MAALSEMLSQLSPASTGPSSPPPPLYPHACTACVQRKVKCDKRHPCLACTKSHVRCTYRSTPPPQRRKRKIVELTRAAANQALVKKLHAHEALLRSAGVSFEALDEGLIAVHGGNNDDEGDGVDDGHHDGDVAGSKVQALALAAEGRSTNDGPLTAESLTIKQKTAAATTAAAHESQVPLFPRQRGVLIPEHGGKRYYEHALIGLLGQQYKQGPPLRWHQPPLPQDAVLPSLVTGLATTPQEASCQHPPASSILQYWSIFRKNVHPLTMIVHAPTVQHIMVDRGDASSFSSSAADSPPRSRDALKFSIYACAVASLKDQDCQQLFGDSQVSLLQTMQSATRYALMESSFLRLPDLDLLRAFVLLLTSMLHTIDSPSLWVMLGTAIRLAQAQGLHRDGAALGLSPFDTEMRRRLWWYVVSLEARVTEIMGSESSLPQSTDTLLPSNINDHDLDPNMATLPVDGPGASDMMFCLVEYETARFLQRRDPRVNYDGPDSQLRSVSNQSNTSSRPTMQNSQAATVGSLKLFTVSNLEGCLENKFLRFCDPVVPLHLLTTTIARSLICKLRQMAHRGRSQTSPLQTQTQNYPHNRGDGGRGSNSGFDSRAEQTNNKHILTAAARTISYDNLIHSSPSLAGFLWHVRYWFPWGSPIFILKIMASLRSTAEWDDDVQAAWKQMEELHTHHPEFSAFDTEKPEYLLVGEQTLKAWSAREAVFGAESEAGGGGSQRQQQPQPIPQLILDLQAKHRIGGALYQWHRMDRRERQQQQHQQHRQVAVNNAANGDVAAMVDAEATDAAVGGNLEDVVASFNNTTSFSAAAAAAVAAGETGGGGSGGLGMVDSPFMGVDWSDWDATRMY